MTCPHVCGYPFHQERIGRGVTGEWLVYIATVFFLSILLTPLSQADNPYVPLQSMGTSFDASDEKPRKFKDDAHAVSTREVDTAAELVSGDQSELDPKEALRIRCVSVRLTKGKLLTSLGGRLTFTLCLSCVVSFFECFVVSQTDKSKVLYWLV